MRKIEKGERGSKESEEVHVRNGKKTPRLRKKCLRCRWPISTFLKVHTPRNSSSKEQAVKTFVFYFSEVNKKMLPATPTPQNDARPQSIGHLIRTRGLTKPSSPCERTQDPTGVCRLLPGTFHDCTPSGGGPAWSCPRAGDCSLAPHTLDEVLSTRPFNACATQALGLISGSEMYIIPGSSICTLPGAVYAQTSTHVHTHAHAHACTHTHSLWGAWHVELAHFPALYVQAFGCLHVSLFCASASTRVERGQVVVSHVHSVTVGVAGWLSQAGDWEVFVASMNQWMKCKHNLWNSNVNPLRKRFW